MASQFDLSLEDKTALHAVKVEFVSLDAVARAKAGESPSAYAEFVDGELTFH